jgi:hypothetical protein
LIASLRDFRCQPVFRRFSSARKNALCHRAFLQSRMGDALYARSVLVAVGIVARKRTTCALRCADGASRTRFLKWNAAFFVVL